MRESWVGVEALVGGGWELAEVAEVLEEVEDVEDVSDVEDEVDEVDEDVELDVEVGGAEDVEDVCFYAFQGISS